jgi:thiol-disulfide isomerase/thioredoxin
MNMRSATLGRGARTLIVVVAACGGLKAQIATVTPEQPKWGNTLQVTYDPSSPGAQFRLTDPVWAASTIYFEDYSARRLAAPMTSSGNRLRYEVVIPDGACLFKIEFVTPHDYDPKATATVVVFEPNGKPARDAYRHLIWDHQADADRYFREEIQLYPENFAAYRDRWFYASYGGTSKELAAIRTDLEKIGAPRQEPSTEWLYAMSYAHLRLGNAEQARTALEQMIQMFPTSPLTSDALHYYIFRSSGAARHQAQRWERKLVSDHPDSAHAGLMVGTLAADKDFPFDVVQSVARVLLRQDPDDPTSYLALAKASLAHQRDYPQALGDLQKVIGILLEGRYHIRRDPDGTLTQNRLAEAYRLRAEINLAQGSVSDALAAVKAAESFERDNNPAGHLIEGRIWWAVSDWRRAETASLEAWRRDPGASEDQLRKAYERVRGNSDGFQSYLDANRAAITKDNQQKKSPFAFDAVSLDGKHWSLQQLKGKIIALNFWFVGCLPCRKEIPVLNQLVEQYKGVVFLGLALDGEVQLGDFLKKFPFHYEIIPNAQKIADGFHVAAYPTHILINPAGEIEVIEDVESLKAALARMTGIVGR